ncbi:unnamed protein product [Rotaria sordida]|uniref:Uncharacterized protein n=1 Tax=Rotaria sordida TaxID=392033 RepID=A0A819SI18_9BILA|nr:unnamed protein product [Rotaria sordida]
MARPKISTEDISRYNHLFNRERVNLESHQLIWLDANWKKDKTTLENLRKIVDYTKIFDNMDECLVYINQTDTTVTFLICSGQMGETFTSKVHHFDSIYAIYIYCQNKEYHQKWASKYSKVRQVHNSLEHLINDLTATVQEYKQHENTNLLGKGQKEATTSAAAFSWWEDFIDMLILLPYPEDYQSKLINLLKNYYNDKEEEMKILDEFSSTYKSSNAVHWYTRETFLYRIMNKALRQQNTELIFLFGFFIQDLSRQVKFEYENFKLLNLKKPIISLYRGQLMSKDEIEELASGSGGCLGNNCFFSTSLQRSLALSFLPQPSKIKGNLQRVLFEIQVDIRQPCRYFADITHVNYVPHESEILFTIGTEFRKEEVKYNQNEDLWIIPLELNNDYDQHDSREFEISSEKFTISNCLNICTDWNFCVMSSTDSINLIFDGLIALYPMYKEWILAAQYHSLANRNGDWEERNVSLLLSYYDKALKCWKKHKNDSDLNIDTSIGKVYKDMAYYYACYIRDSEMCLKHYDMAINHLKLALEKEVSKKSIYAQTNIYQILSDTYYAKMERIIDSESKNHNNNQSHITMTIKYAELCIQHMLKCYEFPDFKTAKRFKELAKVYESIKDYDNALINYDKALRIYFELVKEISSYFYNTVDKILELCAVHKNDHHTKLEYQLLKHEYTLKIAAPSSTDNDYAAAEKKREIASSYYRLGDFYQSIYKYDEALDSYQRALMIHEQELESHHYQFSGLIENITNIYFEHKHDHQLALKYQLMYHEYIVKQSTPDTRNDDQRQIDRKKYQCGVSHISLSDFYVKIHQYDLAKEHLLKALDLYEEVQTMTLEHKIEIINEKLKTVQKFLT